MEVCLTRNSKISLVDYQDNLVAPKDFQELFQVKQVWPHPDIVRICTDQVMRGILTICKFLRIVLNLNNESRQQQRLRVCKQSFEEMWT